MKFSISALVKVFNDVAVALLLDTLGTGGMSDDHTASSVAGRQPLLIILYIGLPG